MKKEIQGMVIGDIHLGNARNPAVSIAYSLRCYLIENNDRLKEADYLIMGGDFVDRLLSLGSEESNAVIATGVMLAKYCSKNNIKLRFLKGTPSHDFDQLSTFDNIFKDRTIEVDYKYYDDIAIEIDDGVHILYIPDEASETPEITMAIVESKMVELNIDYVDFVVMHGFFSYQLPFNSHSAFKEEMFSFVKYYVFVNHIHTHNPKGKIIPPGSFDRLAFGEESPKGAVFFKLNPLGPKEFTFVENKRAKLYSTLDIKTNDVRIALEYVDKYLSNYTGKDLRLRVADNSLDTSILYQLCKDKGINLSFVDTKDKEDTLADIEVDIVEQFSITKDNVVRLLITEMNLEETPEFLEEMQQLI